VHCSPTDARGIPVSVGAKREVGKAEGPRVGRCEIARGVQLTGAGVAARCRSIGRQSSVPYQCLRE